MVIVMPRIFHGTAANQATDDKGFTITELNSSISTTHANSWHLDTAGTDRVAII